jgi:hypothetical protein
LKAQIKSLTQWNAELLHRRPGQLRPEMNKDGHEEEEHNNHTDSYDFWEDDHQEDNFREVHPQELRRPYSKRRMHEILAELLPTWREGAHTWRMRSLSD